MQKILKEILKKKEKRIYLMQNNAKDFKKYIINYMPIYYHIHRSSEPSLLEKELIKGKPLYFSKKNSFWYNVEKSVGENDYGGYIIYKIYIPKLLFTTSFEEKNKIVRITSKNINEYNKLLKEYPGNINFINEMKKRGIIGIDATSNFIANFKYMNLTEKPEHITPEGYLWDFPKMIKITKIQVFDTKDISGKIKGGCAENDLIYLHKYMKYKNKYLHLKINNESTNV